MAGNNRLPIDRGWAWVITFASCGIFGFITGSLNSRGIILVELQECFPEAPALSIIWVLNINTLMDRTLGPLNGIILSRTSHRTLSLLGSSIMSVGLIAFAYSPRIEYMFVAYALFGWGSGMCYLSAMTAYQPYFEKWKALSLGITGAGSGIGTMLLSPLLRFLFDNFSFSGAMLLYAGVCLQSILLASLLRPISFYRRITRKKGLASDETNPAEFELKNNSASPSQTVEEENDPQSSLDAGTDTSNVYTEKISALPLDEKTSEAEQSSVSQSTETIKPRMDVSDQTQASKSFNWRLAYHPRCIMLGICTLLHVSALTGSFPSIPPLGKQTGVSKELVSGLFMAAGGLEIGARTLNGWFADRKMISAYNQLGLCMTLTGVCALLCATLSNSSGTAGVSIILFGLSSFGTSVFSLIPIVCEELFGAENVRSGTAIIFVYQGLSIVVSSFSAGGIYTWSGNWVYVFYWVSCSQLLAGLLMMLTATISFCLNRRSA